jgi:hypothetical protein
MYDICCCDCDKLIVDGGYWRSPSGQTMTEPRCSDCHELAMQRDTRTVVYKTAITKRSGRVVRKEHND